MICLDYPKYSCRPIYR